MWTPYMHGTINYKFYWVINLKQFVLLFAKFALTIHYKNKIFQMYVKNYKNIKLQNKILCKFYYETATDND